MKKQLAFGGARFISVLGKKDYRIKKGIDFYGSGSYVAQRYFAEPGGSFMEEFYFQPWAAAATIGGGVSAATVLSLMRYKTKP